MKKLVILLPIMAILFACGGEIPASGDLIVDTVLDHDKATAGDTTNVKCVVHDVYGNEVYAPTDILFQTPKGVDAPTIDKGDFVLTKSGLYKVACEVIESKVADDSPAKLTIIPGPPIRTVTTVDPDKIGAGDPAKATCTALDKYDNPVPDAPVLLDPVKDLTIEGMQVKSKVPGEYNLTCSVKDVKMDDKTSAKLTVTAGRPARVELKAKPRKKAYNLHNKVTLSYIVYDAYDNVVPDIHGEITPPADSGIKDLGMDQFQFMAEGTYEFTVMLDEPYSDISGSLTLICDIGPPVITILYPDRGMTFDGKPSLTVTGTVTDLGSGVRWVKVNGIEVDLDEKGAFSFVMQSVHGLNPILVEALDNVGNKSKLTRGYYYSTKYIHFADDANIDDVVISDGGMMYMGQKALDDGDHDPSHINDLATIVEVLLGSIDYNQLLGTLPPMRFSIPINLTLPGLNFLGVKIGLTGDLTLGATITDIQFGKPHVDLILEDGGIDTQITMQPISVSIEVTATMNAFAGVTVAGKQYGATISPGGTTATSATIGKLLINTEVMISKKPSDAKASFKMKNFHVETQNINIQPITKFVIDLGDIKIAGQTIHLGQMDLTKSIGGLSKLISDNLLNPLLNSQLLTTLSNVLEPLVENVMTLAFNQLINMLVLDQSIDIPLGPIGTLPLHIKTSLSTVEFTKEAATIGLNLGTLTKKGVQRDPLGTILRDGCMSRDGEKPFTFHKTPAIQLGGRYDFLNEALFAVWWSGLINQKLDLGSLGGLGGGGTGGGGGMDLSGTVIIPNLLLPPILDDCNADGNQEIQVGDMYLDLKLNISGINIHVGMWIQAKADAEIVGQGNKIGIKINDITYMEAEIIDLGGLPAMFKNLLNSLVPMLKNMVQGKEFTFPIPPIDLGGLIPGLPAGSTLQLGNMSAYHEHGFGTVGGELQ